VSTALAMKYALALFAVIGIWLIPGRTRSAGPTYGPIPVYIIGGNLHITRSSDSDADDLILNSWTGVSRRGEFYARMGIPQPLP
jgi:hypothetical protein